MNALRHGSEAMQHSETMIAGSNNSSGPMSGTANVDDAVSGKTGKALHAPNFFGSLHIPSSNKFNKFYFINSYKIM